MQGSSSSSGSDASLILKRCIVLDRPRGRSRDLPSSFPRSSPCGSVCVFCAHIFRAFACNLSASNQPTSLCSFSISELLLYNGATVYFGGAAGIVVTMPTKLVFVLLAPVAQVHGCASWCNSGPASTRGGHIDQHNAVARVRSYATIVSRSRELRSDEKTPTRPVVTGKRCEL